MKIDSMEAQWVISQGILDPVIVRSRQIALCIAGIDDPARLDEHDLALLLGVRLVPHALGDDQHLSLAQLDGPILKFNQHRAFDDDEHLIRIRMVMPDEFTLDLHQLELVIVHLCDHLRRPVFREFR